MFTGVLDYCSEAKVVGFDILFAEPDWQWPKRDLVFAEEVERVRTRRARLDAEVEGLIGRRDGARRRIRDRVRALYRLRRAGVLPLAGGFEALLRHLARVDRLERQTA